MPRVPWRLFGGALLPAGRFAILAMVNPQVEKKALHAQGLSTVAGPPYDYFAILVLDISMKT
jgi:hypothetical protein